MVHPVALTLRGIDPGLDGQLAGQPQAGRIGQTTVPLRRVEIERLTHHARAKGDSSLQRPVVSASGIIGVAFSGPPTDQARGWGRTGRSLINRTLARAAGVVDGGDFGAERARL